MEQQKISDTRLKILLKFYKAGLRGAARPIRSAEQQQQYDQMVRGGYSRNQSQGQGAQQHPPSGGQSDAFARKAVTRDAIDAKPFLRRIEEIITSDFGMPIKNQTISR